MRLFVALNFDDKFKLKLSRYIGELSKNAERGNFTRMSNLHLTLQFIGETQNKSAAEAALTATSFESFELTFDHISGFKRHGSEICWLGVKNPEKLRSLAETVGGELKKQGFILENRPFVAHMTLGREVIFKNGFLTESVQIPNDLVVRAKKISLMKSERIKGILTYTEIYTKRALDT